MYKLTLSMYPHLGSIPSDKSVSTPTTPNLPDLSPQSVAVPMPRGWLAFYHDTWHSLFLYKCDPMLCTPFLLRQDLM